MRLKYEKKEELESIFKSGRSCYWDRAKSFCANPKYEEYEQNCLRAIEIWRESNSKTLNPKYPNCSSRVRLV